MQITISNSVFTPGPTGNVIAASTALAAGATKSATISIGVASSAAAAVSAAGLLQVTATGGTTIGAVSGVNVQLYRSADGVNFDTSPYIGIQLPVAQAPERKTVNLDPGVYQVNMTNTDPTNAITVSATLGLLG